MSSQNNVFIDFCLEQRTIEEVAEKMFSLCDENGVLYIPEFYDGTGTDYELNFQRVELKWNRKDLKKTIKECNKIASAIKEIVCYFGRTDVLKVEKEKAKSILPKRSVAVLEKYLRPDYKAVTDKNLYFILFYAQKAYRGLRTSEAVCYEDINRFLQAMIVSKFAKSVEKVDSSDFNITKSLRDKGYVINAIGDGAIGGVFKYAAKELRADKDVVFAAVTKYGYNLRYAADEFKNDKAFILDAVKAKGWVLQYVKDEFKADKEIVLAAVRRDGLALEYASEDLKADKEVVLEAVKKSGFSVQYAADEFKNDKAFILDVIKTTWSALQCVKDEFKADKEIVLTAVRRDGFALVYAAKELKGDKEVVLEALKQCPTDAVFQHVSAKLKKDSDVLAVYKRSKINGDRNGRF